MGSRVLKNQALIAVAVGAFFAIFFFGVPFPLVVLGAGLLGFVGGHYAPHHFPSLGGHGVEATAGQVTALYYDHPPASIGRTLSALAVCLSLWFLPIVVLAILFGRFSIYVEQGIFFSQAAVVTFGGAYAVLTYVKQKAVDHYHWLQSQEMLDGLGLAESTPGPLIMVVQFVAFLGAYRDPAPLSPLLGGLVGSAITVWVTFVPSFTWVFLGAPYIERLRKVRLLGSMLSTITAAVVGAIANLIADLSLHTLFRQVEERRWPLIGSDYPAFRLHWLEPQLSSLSVATLVIALIAGVMLFRLKRSLAETLLVSVALGMAIHLFGWDVR